MVYTELIGDIWFAKVTPTMRFVQCISGDLAMGKGIAVQFNERYNCKVIMQQMFPECRVHLGCYETNQVYNLVTKTNASSKPTYSTLECALYEMKRMVLSSKVNTLVMPTIGCGLDRLHWGVAREIIKDVFRDTDITVVVYKKSM